MYNTKLMNLLILIEEEEKMELLHKYLRRQYDKNDALQLHLWEYFRKNLCKRTEAPELFKRSYIQEKLFNNNKKSLNRTASRLFLKVKSYMIEGYLAENQITEDWLFRESVKNTKSRIKELMTERLINDERKSENRIEDALQLFIKFHLNYEKYQEQSLMNSDVQLFNKSRELFKEYYTRYFSILEAERKQREKMFDEDILSLTALNEDKNEAALSEVDILFEQVKRLEENPNMEDFNYCKDTFLEFVENGKISREMQLTIFSVIMNFANRQSKEGSKEYLFTNINYFIYLGLDKKILYVDNKISMYIYINFLSLVAGYRKLKDIEDYTFKYEEDVDDIDKASFFSTLFIEFYSGNYEGVIDNININENNISIGFEYSFRIRIWVFLMCSYFEVKNEEALAKVMNSFRRYLKSQMISDVLVKIYLNLMQYIKDIFKANKINNITELNKIEIKLANEKLITYENWLKEKIKESQIRITKHLTP